MSETESTIHLTIKPETLNEIIRIALKNYATKLASDKGYDLTEITVSGASASINIVLNKKEGKK